MGLCVKEGSEAEQGGGGGDGGGKGGKGGGGVRGRGQEKQGDGASVKGY